MTELSFKFWQWLVGFEMCACGKRRNEHGRKWPCGAFDPRDASLTRTVIREMFNQSLRKRNLKRRQKLKLVKGD